MQSRTTASMGCEGSNSQARSRIAVGLVVGAVAFGLEVKEETLREVLFVFDDHDEGSFTHAFSPIVLCLGRGWGARSLRGWQGGA